MNRAETQNQDAQLQLQRNKTKMEGMAKELNDFKQQIKSLEVKHKAEMTKITQERDELIKQITKIEHKETQYKHEIKNRDL